MFLGEEEMEMGRGDKRERVVCGAGAGVLLFLEIKIKKREKRTKRETCFAPLLFNFFRPHRSYSKCIFRGGLATIETPHYL